jgi:hypothetical protein
MIFDGCFEIGRPFCLIIFKDLRFNIFWILINIHAGHNHETLISIFQPIQNLINLNIEKINKYDIKRIVIVGDFNRDISSQNIFNYKKFKLYINNIDFYFLSLQTKNKTCCSIKGWGYKNNYDQVIDSFNKPIIIHQLNKEDWYNSKSSDHIGILSIVKNYI